MDFIMEARPSYSKADKKLHKAVSKIEKDIGKITSKSPTKVSCEKYKIIEKIFKTELFIRF